MLKVKYLGFILLGLMGITSCNNEKNYVPKPPTFLELNFPERSYEIYTDSCGYSYNKPSYFNVQAAPDFKCNRDIEFSTLNGTLHLGVMEMEEPLARYVDYAIDKVGEHKVKATAILDTSFYRTEARVFGTLFELQGNVASPFQFYLTDSVSRFVSGVVYFNTLPNYDSIKPSLDFVKKDLYEFINTLEWN